jgi:hypothetical protein
MEVKWVYDKYPCEELPGIYAISYCWDCDEGSFCGLNLWHGNEWEEGLPIIAYAGPFESEYEAEDWLERNDIST